ncbi:MAG: hypothetical protein AAF125_11805, partial [Chloroflexota bacterium]
IVFTTSRDGFQELYTMRPDGTDLRRLTKNVNQNDLTAAYSPDGAWLAYATNYSVGDNSGDLWLMRADGTDQRQLTDLDATHQTRRRDRSPIWSPDGRYIAYLRQDGSVNTDIFLYDMAQDEHRELTTTPDHNFNPVWSPDGQWLAYVSSTSNGREAQIFTVHSNGHDTRALTVVDQQYRIELWYE